MAQAAEDQKSEPRNIWPTALLLNQAYAMTFACSKCKGMPISCMNNEDGDIFCGKCAKEIDNISVNKAMQRIINKLKTKCLSLYDEAPNNDTDEGNVIATQIKDNQCDWTGMIQEWQQHSTECAFLVIRCNECHVFKSQRKLMNNHMDKCPELSIDCPLSCGSSILRKNTETHLANDCSEKLMDCTNEDCKLQVKRKEFTNHINNDCETRIIQCEFVKFGCLVKKIKANQLKVHMEEFKFDHISKKFDFLTTQLNGKILEQNVTISKLQQSNDILVKELNDVKAMQSEQTNKISEMEEKKEPTLWKNAVYSNSDTGLISSGGSWKCLIHMTLPQKAGKYVCKYSMMASAASKGGYWIHYDFKLGSTRLGHSNGLYLNSNCGSYRFPLSSAVIVELNGNENEEQRKLGLYHNPYGSYPSAMARCFLEAYEIE